MALLALGGLLLLRRPTARAALAAVCGVVIAVHTWIWLPWVTSEKAGPGPELTVMAVNVYRGGADTGAISTVVREQDVDVLAMSEVRETTVDRLGATGLTHRLPHAYPAPPPPEGTMIVSRLPLQAFPDAGGPITGTTALRNPAAVLRSRGGVVVRAVHPPPPVPGRVLEWRATLADLSRWAEQTPGPLVVAGDFNASVDHPGMRQLLAAGLRDAHETAGAGRPTTWPNGRSVPPFVHLDHVLVRGLDVESVEDFRIPGTDHDAVVVHLVQRREG